MAAGFITVGLALKAAVFPMHTWMPSAYAFAPSAVAVFFSACTTKVSLYILFRLDFTIFQANLGEHQFHFTGFLMSLAVLERLGEVVSELAGGAGLRYRVSSCGVSNRFEEDAWLFVGWPTWLYSRRFCPRVRGGGYRRQLAHV